MANPWGIATMSPTVAVVGWLLSPIINWLLQNLFAYLIFDASKELPELVLVTVPALKLTLREVEEHRMLRAARDDKGSSRSDLERLDKMDMLLKSALYEAEDILDLVEYYQIEKKVTGGNGSSCVKRLFTTAVAYIARCCRWIRVKAQGFLHNAGAWIAGWWGILIQRCIDITPAPLLQFVHSMKQKLGQLFGGVISLWSSGTLLPISQVTSTVGVERLCGCCNQIVTSITSCFPSLLSWCTDQIHDARYYRNWSYEQVGFNVNEQRDGNVPINERIRLRKQIKSIQDILTSSKKSNLLNQNSSSTAKDDDKESSSNSPAKNSDKDNTKKAGNKDSSNSTAKQKEIDKLYKSIEQKVFGRDKHLKHISDMLREGPGTNAASSSSSKPYSVIGIYGITGSGKTTLAQYVCDYEKEAGHFDPVMFTHVGKTFSLGNIFCDMLEQITHTRPPNNDSLTSLKAKLKETLRDKRFLFVLDDLWVNDDNQMELDILLEMLRLCAARSGSRVLVTSQKTDAAEALGAQQQISIPDLEEGVYLSLFMHHARPDACADDGEYERIGRKIANRLGRSPIAAVTVGKQLQRNKSISFWETTANLDVLNKTMGALWWSYQQLGVDIRRCFAYCSTFPKGYGLQRDELVRIWIAQGFVNTRSDAKEELEDVGQHYFDLLLTFSFLQVSTKYYWPVMMRFTSHDLLHELAERVSSGEFFRIGLNDPPKDIPQGVRHVFIETICRAEVAEKIVDMENLRTLIIEEPHEKLHEIRERNHDLEKILERLFMRLTKLRVLIIEVGPWRNELSVPASIEKMKHLRYLGFCSKAIGPGISNLVLPSTFSKLYHMQTIDIPGYGTSCPEDMANLINLRHIFRRLSFPNIGRLTALQTLIKFRVEEGQGYRLKQLMQLNKLRGNLKIQGLEFVRSKEEALEAQLTHKERLRILELDFGCDGPDVEAEVLEGLCPPIDLEELKIDWYKGSRYPSWMLSRYHTDTRKHLHRLKLFDCSQLASIPEGSELFIGLRELCIQYCDWDSLPENMERLVSLQTLDIESCKNMQHLPTLPRALKRIKISECDILRSIGIMECPRLEFILEKKKRLEACTSLECCQDTAPTGTPEQSPYPVIPCPCLVTLQIEHCANLVALPNLPPSLKNLSIHKCHELCSVSGQLDQLEKLDIYKCDKLQSVDSLGDASSLETLDLSECRCLASLGSSGGPGSYSALRQLWIEYCPAMDMRQFNKNVLDSLVNKNISHALSSNSDERV